MKKVFSLFLSLIMLLSVTAGIDFSSFADDDSDVGTIVDHNHIYNEFITKRPTCTEEGIKYMWCTGCDREKTETIPPTGHTTVIDKAVPATCTQTGLTEGSHCSVCNVVFVEQKTVAKISHNYDAGKVTKSATCTANGVIKKSCNICKAVLAQTTIYYPKTITLSKTSYTYDGKVKKPSVVVKDSKGKKIDKKYYSVSYSSGRKNVGKYTVTIKFKGNYSGTVKKTFTIVPKSTTISKLTAGKKAFTAKWKKQSAATGYQIQYATDSKFTKNKKTVTVSKNKTTSKKISKLKAKKKYYVRIRTYKTVKVNGKSTKVYSNWSKAKGVKTK